MARLQSGGFAVSDGPKAAPPLGIILNRPVVAFMAAALGYGLRARLIIDCRVLPGATPEMDGVKPKRLTHELFPVDPLTQACIMSPSELISASGTLPLTVVAPTVMLAVSELAVPLTDR